MKSLLTLLLLLALGTHGTAQLNAIPADRWKLVDQFLGQQPDANGYFMLGSLGKIRYEKGLGYADRSRQMPFDAQTLYSIGSITKPFTATAILLLMEQGKIKPEDPVTKYFSDVPGDKKKITIHQLLTHSAGFPGAIGDDYGAVTSEAFQNLAWNTRLLFTPGEGYEYSNVGYSLLGMIIEKISGLTYSAFLEKNIFQPAGMMTAGYSNPRADYTRLAHGYFTDGRDWGTSKDKNWDGDEPYWHLKANGGLLMSASDLYRWYLALRNHTILKPETLTLQTTPFVPEDEMGESYYGYGYAVSPEGEVVQHNGGNGIFKADFRWFPTDDFFMIACTNDANYRLFMTGDQILDILRTGELPEMITWQTFPLDQFPANTMQETAQKFIDLLQHYTEENKDNFVQSYFTPGIIDRNTPEHINQLFDLLRHDVSQRPIEKIETADKAIQITVPAQEGNTRLKIKLIFMDNRIDRIGAELEG